MPHLSKHITIIAGHYGSGKTEFAVNLAFEAAKKESGVSLVDLDIVNPYFCSREREEQLERAGIRVIAPSPYCRTADVPALPAEIGHIFSDKEGFSLLDVGGDAAGAKVLSRYMPQFEACGYNLWIVANFNRPQTATPQLALEYIRSIESASRLHATGIINNTHLCSYTTPKDAKLGGEMALELSRISSLPLICSVVARSQLKECELLNIAGELFPIDVYMKKPWEN